METVNFIGEYIIPILYFYFAYRFIQKPAPYLDRDGFSTRRARESEEIWTFVQRCAGLYCLGAALALTLLIYVLRLNFPEMPSSIFWLRVGIQILSIGLIVPVVNLATTIKFPK